MRHSDEQIKDILRLKDHIVEQIEKYKEEIELLEKNLGILNSILRELSFTRASSLSVKEEDITTIPITNGAGGEIIANAYVTPEQVSIVLNDDVLVNVDTPPLKTFFLDRILGEMKKKDSADVQSGKIQQESTIEYTVNKNGSQLREIIVKNYRQKERVNEIINTAAWSLARMLENSAM
jgi:hypothetical protein